MVEITDISHLVVAGVTLNGDGTFEFQALQSGLYNLRLVGVGGQVIYEQSVFVTGSDQNVSLRVELRSKNEAGGTVTAKQLQHKVPVPAQKEFSRAMTAAKNNVHAAAIEHFKKATEIDGEFADAYDRLGSEYAATGDYKNAAEQYQKAIELAPDHPDAAPNLSIVLFNLHRYSEAGEMARRALRVAPGLLKLRYILGISLLSDAATQQEALTNLERASVEIPQAHLLAAKILVENGQREGAVKHLTEYLAQVRQDAPNDEKVRAWLAQLQN